MQSKYIFDFLIALIGMIILAPLLLVLTFFVLLFHGMPILFKQERPGYKGRAFFIYKFRTMNNRSTADGSLLADSERLTRFGHFLRATSLDELPELFNILRGEMSLVGPRPLLMQYLPLYNEEQMRRHEMRPGITGWAQINGRNNISWDEKFKLDIWYVDNKSLLLDIKILLLTIKKVLLRKDITSSGGCATSEPFEGNNN